MYKIITIINNNSILLFSTTDLSTVQERLERRYRDFKGNISVINNVGEVEKYKNF